MLTEEKKEIPIFAFVGFSGSGKTTFLEKLIPVLKAKNDRLRIAVIKSDVHGIRIDLPGKDSWRLSFAGADVTVVSSPDKMVMIRKCNEKETLEQVATQISDVDLILAEGFKYSTVPKIEVFRNNTDTEPLHLLGIQNTIAIVCDDIEQMKNRMGVPVFPIDDPKPLADFLLRDREFSAILLAGGKSSRFGKDKMLLNIDGKGIVETLTNQWQQLASEVILVSNKEASDKFEIKHVKEIGDIWKNVGPLGGIHAGLRNASHPTCFVFACDMPFLHIEVVRYLLRKADEYDIVVPRHNDGRVEPLCGVYKKDVLEKVEAMLERGEYRVQKLYQEVKVCYVEEAEWKNEVSNSNQVFFNINYKEDYDNALSIMENMGNKNSIVTYTYQLKEDSLSFEKSMVRDDIALEKAIKLLLQHTCVIKKSVFVPLLHALGMVLVENIYAPLNNPPFHRSPLDGYALRYQDTIGASLENPVKFTIASNIYAGNDISVLKTDVMLGDDNENNKNQAVCIMTGAEVPSFCNCVIRVEDTKLTEDGKILIYHELKKNQNICFCGEDIRKGQLLMQSGNILTATHLGILAGMGFSRVQVNRRVSVGVVSVGDELVLASDEKWLNNQSHDDFNMAETLEKGKIFDSNSIMLSARLSELGIHVNSYSPIGDNPDTIASYITKIAEENDMIITTGGVSVGQKDYIHTVFNMLSIKKLFWGLRLKPGSPVIGGIYKDKPILALSGNPFAAAATFELLARPVLAKMSQREDLNYCRKKAYLMNAFPKKSMSRRFIRGRLVDEMEDLIPKVYIKEGNHSSGAMLTMLMCNVLIDIPAGSEMLAAGEVVDVICL